MVETPRSGTATTADAVAAHPGGTTLRVGSASSTLPDPYAAGRAAAGQALAGLGGIRAGLVLVYSRVGYDLSALLAGVRSVTGRTPLAGATTSGQFRDGEYLPPGSSVMVLVLGARPYQFAVGSVTGIRDNGAAAGRKLARAALDAIDGDRARYGALMLLADGLSPDMQSLLTGIYRVTGAPVPVVGGAAGDDFQLERTYVFHDGQVLTDAAVAVWIGADRPLRVSTRHGWQAQGVPMLVTAVEGTRVTEIAHRPAMEVYREHHRYGRGERWYWNQAFGLVEPDGSQLVRVAYSDDDERLHTLVSLPPFSVVQIMSTDRELLLAVGEQIVADALSGAPDPSVILTFSCATLLANLGRRTAEDAARLQAAAGPVSTFGFYTYGEFARSTSVAGYHNATVTALAL